MTVLRLALPHSTVWVYPDQRLVLTILPDWKECYATREDTEENRQEALDQGYTGPDAVWRSLVDHEVLHNLISDWLWNRPSPTLEHEAGVRRVEYGKRLFEEALVLAFQRYVNTGEQWPALYPFAQVLPEWKRKFTKLVHGMEQAA